MKNTILTICIIAATAILLFSCGDGASNYTTFKDVKIGTQVWMDKNLDVTTFRNGDPIPEAKTNEEWLRVSESQRPAWCYYNNDPKNGEKYGKLYNWYAVNDPRGLAPKGWHVPNIAELRVLIDFLGGQREAGTKMKSKTGWNEQGNGNNESGFNGLPGGGRSTNGTFGSVGNSGGWWSSKEKHSRAWIIHMDYDKERVNDRTIEEQNGLSVRCLRD